jgi:hypothetical protein
MNSENQLMPKLVVQSHNTITTLVEFYAQAMNAFVQQSDVVLKQRNEQIIHLQARVRELEESLKERTLAQRESKGPNV